MRAVAGGRAGLRASTTLDSLSGAQGELAGTFGGGRGEARGVNRQKPALPKPPRGRGRARRARAAERNSAPNAPAARPRGLAKPNQASLLLEVCRTAQRLAPIDFSSGSAPLLVLVAVSRNQGNQSVRASAHCRTGGGLSAGAFSHSGSSGLPSGRLGSAGPRYGRALHEHIR